MPYPELIKDYPISMQLFVKIISNRINSGKNALIPIIGETGSGKSLSAEELCRVIYIYRNGEEPTTEYLLNHTFFRAKPFMESMKQVSDDLSTNKEQFKKGVCWIWDEVGVEAGHKDFMSIRNKILGWLVQTFRNQQQIIFFTTPSISFIDASIRKMLHYLLEVQFIDKKENICVIKPLKLQYNSRMDKIYYHRLKYPSGKKDGGVYEIEVMGVPKPNEELELAYEQKKNDFTSSLNNQILDMLVKMDKNDRPVITRYSHQQIYELYHCGITRAVDIAKKLGKDPSTISTSMRTMNKMYLGWQKNPNLLGKIDFVKKKALYAASKFNLDYQTKK